MQVWIKHGQLVWDHNGLGLCWLGMFIADTDLCLICTIILLGRKNTMSFWAIHNNRGYHTCVFLAITAKVRCCPLHACRHKFDGKTEKWAMGHGQQRQSPALITAGSVCRKQWHLPGEQGKMRTDGLLALSRLSQQPWTCKMPPSMMKHCGLCARNSREV